MRYFGEPWDAPIIDDATPWPTTPTHAACLLCGDRFVDGDQGIVLPHIGDVDPRYVVQVVQPADLEGEVTIVAEHRECLLASTVGHLVGVCTCTGWDTSSRDTGREVLRRVQNGALNR